MPDPLQCQNLEAHTKNLKNKKVDIWIQNSFNKVSLKNHTAQAFCGVTLSTFVSLFFFLWYEKFILVLGKNNPSNETMLNNAEQYWPDIKMTFDMSSWNAKSCIFRNWKHILNGRTFTWSLAESPQAEQKGKLQASLWLEAKRIWFYHWAWCVNMWGCPYLPLYFLCCNLLSFLRCFLCLFWKIKAPVPFPRPPCAPRVLWIPQGVSLCLGTN